MNLQEALEADRLANIMDAAAKYETLIEEGDARSIVIVNLSVLYWQSTDFGTVAAYNLPAEFVSLAGTRSRELLAMLLENEPTSLEGRFWSSYIAWADLGEQVDAEQCRRSLRDSPDYLEPAMYLYAASNGTEAAALAAELLAQSRAQQTVRSRYVTSVIEGVDARLRGA